MELQRNRRDSLKGFFVFMPVLLLGVVVNIFFIVGGNYEVCCFLFSLAFSFFFMAFLIFRDNVELIEKKDCQKGGILFLIYPILGLVILKFSFGDPLVVVSIFFAFLGILLLFWTRELRVFSETDKKIYVDRDNLVTYGKPWAEKRKPEDMQRAMKRIKDLLANPRYFFSTYSKDGSVYRSHVGIVWNEENSRMFGFVDFDYEIISVPPATFFDSGTRRAIREEITEIARSRLKDFARKNPAGSFFTMKDKETLIWDHKKILIEMNYTIETGNMPGEETSQKKDAEKAEAISELPRVTEGSVPEADSGTREE